MGLNAYYTDSEGNIIENPRYLRKAEKRLKQLSRKQSKCEKSSKNRKKAQKQLAKAHVKVQRQREDFARKQAVLDISMFHSKKVLAFCFLLSNTIKWSTIKLYLPNCISLAFKETEH